MQPVAGKVLKLGGCQVELHLAAAEAAWEAPLHGALKVRSSDDWFIIDRLNVYLMASSEGPAVGRETPTLMDSARFEFISVPNGKAADFPFSLRMSWGHGFQFPAQLKVTAEIDSTGHTSHLSMPVKALPPPEFVIVAAAVAEQSGLEVESWSLLMAGDGVLCNLHTGKGACGAFKQISLRLYRGATVVYGNMFLELRAHSFGQHLLAAAGMTTRSVELRLPRGDRRATSDVFRELLLPYVNAVRELPIPARDPDAPAREFPIPSRSDENDP